MASETVLEELEVLESIYPTELHRKSDTDIEIEAEQDEELEGIPNIKLLLAVHYPSAYPDVLPELKLSAVEGEISEKEIEALMKDLHAIGEENLGMAMTFTLVSHLREQLTNLARSNKAEKARLEAEMERLALEEEEARTRGTPVTVDSFKAWKAKFDKEIAAAKAREEEEKLKGLTPKEREEYKRAQLRLTGRQLFERNRNLDERDEGLIEEGTTSVDISQYDRTQEDEEQEEGLTFSDSD
ncbi:hypothetical protein CC1G_04267 [Coprinopsis cinerea okayama7|uniref:RWD domain-containing protein n=1 Tax=Coprinopsis cinerea (strain Okayama-7 / 130 / ATCC MYA-4618 / FGSC 9003) TaxID=240176 RepID=A8NFH8_COPC7|nr:hypothetical protein CC1G_04267 [Coprinopsis cinerea okayama7\|eukprot:XP_001833288.2 hypothetical protein CC1G_04267 [Coprinopsis cinerea okayama7\